MKILVVIPAYNERDNIGRLVAKFFSLGLPLDIVVIDDGADGTDEVIRGMQGGHPNLFLIKRAVKSGRGSAVIEGLRWGLARGYDYFVETDADFSHPPETLPLLLSRAQPGTMVYGSRYIRGGKVLNMTWFRNAFSRAANIFARSILPIAGLTDSISGYRVYPRDIVAKMDFAKIKGRGFSVQFETSYHLYEIGAKFAEVPIVFVNRDRGASKFSFKEIYDAFFSIVKIRFAKKPLETTVFVLLGASFFVGLWHGWPLTALVADEAYHVGGVLRAMEHRTILPLPGDVPYSTVTYLVSYFFVGAYLLLLTPFFAFDLAALRSFLLDRPEQLYVVTRLASALFAFLCLLIMERLGRRAKATSWQRLGVIVLVLGNVLIAANFHTTKVWVLATSMTLLSLYFVYARRVFWAVVFAFVGLANFALNFYAVAAVLPALWLVARKEENFWPRLLAGIAVGALIFAGVTAMNFSNIQAQVVSIFTGDRPESAGSTGIALTAVGRAFWIYVQRLALLFPLLLIPLAFARRIRDRRLFGLSLWYFAVYIAVISFTATWVFDMISFLRYLVPAGFFLGLLLLSLELRWRWVLPAAASVSAVYYLFIIWYLAAPTTYNLALDFAAQNLNREEVVIISEVSHIQMPLNARSAALLEERFCSTRCKLAMERGLNADFKPVVYDKRRSRADLPAESAAAEKAGAEYYLFTSEEKDAELAASFGKLPYDEHFNIDYRLGTYWDLWYFQIGRLGEKIYVYKISNSP